MKIAIVTALLAAASGTSAGVLVKRPAAPPPASSSSASSSSSSPAVRGGCRPRANGLYACFLSSTHDALAYCSTAASVYLTGITTNVIEPGPTHYVSVAAEVVTITEGDLSTATVTSTTGTVTSFDSTVTSTATSTQVSIAYLYQKRDGGVALLDDRAAGVVSEHAALPTVTALVVKRMTVTSTIKTCTASTTAVTVTVKKRKRAAAAAAATATASVEGRGIQISSSSPSASASASDSVLPEPSCVSAIKPGSSVLSSVCSELVTTYGTTPSPVTEVLVLPATTITVSDGVSLYWTVLKSTTTQTVLTVLQVTSVSTTTVSTCTVVTKTLTVSAD